MNFQNKRQGRSPALTEFMFLVYSLSPLGKKIDSIIT